MILGIEVKDFGASWRDGIAFLAIIDAIKKNLVNIAELKKASNRARLETAFDVAESELGIPKILDPVDVDVPKPDEKSIMTYVAQFLHRCFGYTLQNGQISRMIVVSDILNLKQPDLTPLQPFSNNTATCYLG